MTETSEPDAYENWKRRVRSLKAQRNLAAGGFVILFIVLTAVIFGSHFVGQTGTVPPPIPTPGQFTHLAVEWNVNNSMYLKYLTKYATIVSATLSLPDNSGTVIVREIDNMYCPLPTANVLGCVSQSGNQYPVPNDVTVTIQVRTNVTMLVYSTTQSLAYPYTRCGVGQVAQVFNTEYVGITSTRQVPEICLN
jgi:hypothetical protein